MLLTVKASTDSCCFPVAGGSLARTPGSLGTAARGLRGGPAWGQVSFLGPRIALASERTARLGGWNSRHASPPLARGRKSKIEHRRAELLPLNPPKACQSPTLPPHTPTASPLCLPVLWSLLTGAAVV